MQCPACHKEVAAESAFCEHCGAPLNAVPPPPAGYTEVPPAYTTPPPAYASSSSGYAAPPPVATSGLSSNAASAIAYITIIPAIIFLVVAPYNRIPLVRFHSWQSIFFAIASFVVQIILGVLRMMPFGFPLWFMVNTLVNLAIFVVWLITILKAARGEWFKLPIIGDLADRQARS